MTRKKAALHVATTTRRYKDKVYRTHLLRRSFRDGDKVKHETLGNLSHLPEELIELIRRSLKGETFVSGEDALECVRSLPHGHVAAVLGKIRNLGLEKILSSRPCRERDCVLAMIASRVIDPRSKLATTRGLRADTAFSTLGEALGLDQVTENELYSAMDWLHKRQGQIEKKLAARHLQDGTLVLYDVSSSYYEGRHCPLVQFGHNRDLKKGKKQIVYGMLCERRGRPIAVEVFEGNTADPTTIPSLIKKIRQRFGLKRVVIVGDRGMLTEARIREDLKPVDGLSWITALRAPAIRSLLKAGAFDRSLFDKQDLAEITSPDYPGERLIVCLNPLLQEERARKRKDLLQATEKQLDKIVAATQRKRNPLKSSAEIGKRIGAVLNKFKVGKHFHLEIKEHSFTYHRKNESIESESALDGFYIVRTNVAGKDLGPEETVRTYKSLAHVERAFRCVKTVDLKVRPIFHRDADRVRAHVFLCMLAYYVEWHMREDLAPILFDDHDLEQATDQRPSIVAPAKRSKRCLEKMHSKTTELGTPVHSFQTLLQDLATMVKNVMRAGGSSGETFTVLTSPTKTQQQAFKLLGLSQRL
jgi:transposase